MSLISSCNNEKENKNSLFTKLSAKDTGIRFVNEVKNKKDFNIFRYRNFYNGGGVAIGDINSDGLPDIYFTSNLGKNKLYLNKGNFKFEDVTETAEVGGHRTWSTGVTMVDINADGLLDIYVCNAGDIEGKRRQNELFINKGELQFSEEASKYGLADNGFTTHTAFFDYDLDGDLDAYILNNSFIPVSSLNYNNKRTLRDEHWNVPEVLRGGGDKLLRNDNGRFVNVSEDAGIYGSLIGFGLGVAISDINKDNYPDIYVSNDFYEHDYLYINNGDGTFKEDTKNRLQHISHASMGADIADINNDGNPDIFVTDMLPESDMRLKESSRFESYDFHIRSVELDFHEQFMQNTLQLNTDNGKHFKEIAYFSGIAKTDWSWGALLFDMDNDGYRDVYVCNGVYHDLTDQDFIDFFANDIIQKMVLTGKKEEIESIIDEMPSTPVPNYAFQNQHNLKFTNVTKEWGFELPSFSNGAAYADLDNDGDLDLVVNNINSEAFIFKNNTDKLFKNNFIKIKVEGRDKNTFGIGAKVDVFCNDKIIHQELFPGRGFQSSVEPLLTIGIGKMTIDSLRITWNNGSVQTLKNVMPNQTLTLNIGDAESTHSQHKTENKETLFTRVQTNLPPHKENFYIDFDNEGLISEMLSKEGPPLAIGDIDGDGNEDLFIGGAFGSSGHLFLQKKEGRFLETSEEVFKKDTLYEDTATTFTDVDSDGDLDLLVASGGNQKNVKLQNRLYINKGKGIFSVAENPLPTTNSNISVILPIDFDNDKDTDLFIGGRSVPTIYGVKPKHLILENDGKGNFRDVTQKVGYDLTNYGMLTDAIWRDMNGDGLGDLIVVGDWEAPKIFINKEGVLKSTPSALSGLVGWWNAIKVSDFNNDGYLDIILANQGTNIPYLPTKQNPVSILINDFDGNGTIEQIITREIDGKDKPISLKGEITQQLVSLKKENLKYKDYAQKSIQELLTKDIIENSILKRVTIAESVIAWGKGGNDFEIMALPEQVQFSSIYSIFCQDINNDGKEDILLGGNNFDLKPQFGRLDANLGITLLTGNNNFEVLNHNQSGFLVKGMVKAIKSVTDKKGNTYILVIKNNENPVLFKLNL